MTDWMELGPVIGAVVVAGKALDLAVETYKTRKNGNVEKEILEKVTDLGVTMAVIVERVDTHLDDHKSGKV